MKTTTFFIVVVCLFSGCNSSTKKNNIEEIQSQKITKENHEKDKVISNSEDIFYVKAKSGLIIRKEPKTNSDKLGKFNYSDQVQIIKKTQINISITDEGKVINGEWYKVSGIKKSSVTGYVFSGFLTKKKIEHPFHIDLITKWLPEIEGCTCHFSLNKDDLEEGDRYVFLSTMGSPENIAFVKINNTLQKFNQEKKYWKNSNYKLFIETKVIERNGEETWLQEGKMILKSKDGIVLEIEIYGECGC